MNVFCIPIEAYSLGALTILCHLFLFLSPRLYNVFFKKPHYQFLLKMFTKRCVPVEMNVYNWSVLLKRLLVVYAVHTSLVRSAFLELLYQLGMWKLLWSYERIWTGNVFLFLAIVISHSCRMHSLIFLHFFSFFVPVGCC